MKYKKEAERAGGIRRAPGEREAICCTLKNHAEAQNSVFDARPWKKSPLNILVLSFSHNRFNMTLCYGIIEFSRTCYYIISAFKDFCFNICRLVKWEIQHSCFALDLVLNVFWFIQI